MINVFNEIDNKLNPNDNELLLCDRVEKIKAINKQFDLENNGYLAFSGGKDSLIVHYLLDIALPNNNIPRVYANTGLEFNDMRKFVQSLASQDKRIVILKQTRNIKKTLEQYGYPFKSKEYSLRIEQYNKGNKCKFYKKIFRIG